MQTIKTKFLQPTDNKGSRIKAIAEAGLSITIDYDYAVSTSEAHAQAIKALKNKLGWDGAMVMGACDGGYVAVFCNDTIIE